MALPIPDTPASASPRVPACLMTRREVVPWLLVGGSALMNACSRREAEINPGARVRLTLWVLEENQEPPDVYAQITEEFMRANPDIAITVERRANDAYKEALRLAINTPTAPDGYFSWSGPGLGGFYVRNGGARPIEDYYARYGWAKRFAPTTLACTHFFGRQYGVPFRLRSMAVYFRRDAFAKAGITQKPETFEELLEANRKLLAAGYTPMGMAGKFGWMTMRLLDCLLETMCGAERFDALRALTADWTHDPGVTRAFAELKRWADAGFLTRNFLGLDPMAVRMSVYRGRAAMTIEGDWMVDVLQSDGMNLDDYDFFPFPTGTHRLYFFTDQFFISSTTPHADEVARLYDFWTSPETQRRHAGQFGTLSPTLGIAPPAHAPEMAREWRRTIARFPAVFWPSDQALPIEIFASYVRVLTAVLSGLVAPEAAGAAIQTDIRAYQVRTA